MLKSLGIGGKRASEGQLVTIEPKAQRPAEPPPDAHKKELGDGLLAVYVSGGRSQDDPYYIFVQNTDRERPLELNLNFSASQNLVMTDGAHRPQGHRLSVVVKPESVSFAAQLEPQKASKHSELQWRANWRQLEPDPLEQERKLRTMQDATAKRIAQMVSVHKRLLKAGKDPFDAETVRLAAETDGLESLVDIFFAPTARSIGAEPLAARKPWRRPIDFVDDLTTEIDESELMGVFFQEISADDIVQGELGNCWFMCALASLIEFPETIERLFMTAWPKSRKAKQPMYDKQGYYELRLCMHGPPARSSPVDQPHSLSGPRLARTPARRDPSAWHRAPAWLRTAASVVVRAYHVSLQEQLCN